MQNKNRRIIAPGKLPADEPRYEFIVSPSFFARLDDLLIRNRKKVVETIYSLYGRPDHATIPVAGVKFLTGLKTEDIEQLIEICVLNDLSWDDTVAISAMDLILFIEGYHHIIFCQKPLAMIREVKQA